MKRAVKCSAALLAVLCTGIFGLCVGLSHHLPDEITAYCDQQISFNNISTISLYKQYRNSFCPASNAQPLTETAFSEHSSDSTQFAGEVQLFNIIPVKTITVHQTEKKYVIPCGHLFGIKFYTKGAAVIECCTLESDEGRTNPGRECGLSPGDTILELDGVKIRSCADVERITAQSDTETISMRCLHNGREFATNIRPVISDGVKRLGLWIKDSAAGLGTMTFRDPETGLFASLGHGICDSDTGELLELDRAEITRAEISDITKSMSGVPGSINGYFCDDNTLGRAITNSELGLYGELYQPISDMQPVEIAPICEIRRGSAQILCTLDNSTPELYDVEITDVDYDEKNKTKNLQITATDPRLIEKTGGIVQGMSGSPILQNGKLVGAVTHVLVTNSAKGYGIFAQNMYEETQKARNSSR